MRIMTDQGRTSPPLLANPSRSHDETQKFNEAFLQACKSHKNVQSIQSEPQPGPRTPSNYPIGLNIARGQEKAYMAQLNIYAKLASGSLRDYVIDKLDEAIQPSIDLLDAVQTKKIFESI